MMKEAKAGQMTTKVINSISSHLSSRQDCKGVEYLIKISEDPQSEDDIIEVSPFITVFPSIHNRKECDRRSVEYHVISQHFPEILAQSEDQQPIHIVRGSLVLGMYVYKKYSLTARRKWKKINVMTKKERLQNDTKMGEKEV